MGTAIDTVGFTRTGPAGGDSAPQASTVVSGDSFTVRSFAPPAQAILEGLFFIGSAKDIVRVRSPYLHDNVAGIQFVMPQSPSKHPFPARFPQYLSSQDTLVVEQEVITATNVDVGALRIYYSNLGGINARLHMPADFMNSIQNLKLVRVTMPAGGAASVWLDALITTTENLLRANTDYAVLGFLTDTALAAVGVKGQDTGNLRICGPGTLDEADTSSFFADESDRRGTPHVPIINAANANNTYVSALSNASPTGANIQLVLAELGTPLP